MNYLAHIHLARHSDLAMIGALLGDFEKSPGGGKYPRQVEQEIMLHRLVDSFTDAHPITRGVAQRFDPARRRFAGILLDVFYDHMLARDWARYCDVPLTTFIQRFYTALRTHAGILPISMHGAVEAMITQDWLGAYQDLAGIELTITRISRRLSRNREAFCAGMADLRDHYQDIADAFSAFYPELERHIQQHRSARAVEASPAPG